MIMKYPIYIEVPEGYWITTTTVDDFDIDYE